MQSRGNMRHPLSCLLDSSVAMLCLPLDLTFRLLKLAQRKAGLADPVPQSVRQQDEQQRREQLHLDHLEEHYRCCVCHAEGKPRDALSPAETAALDEGLAGGGAAPVDAAARREALQHRVWLSKKRDKGLVHVNRADVENFSQVLGTAVRGFLCDTCMALARFRVESMKRKHLRDGNLAPERFAVNGRPIATAMVLLAPWAIEAVSAMACGGCRRHKARYFHTQRRVFACVACHARWRHTRLNMDVTQPLPSEVARLLESMLSARRPNPAAGLPHWAAATYVQPADLFTGAPAGGSFDLFAAQESGDAWLTADASANASADASTIAAAAATAALPLKFSDAHFSAKRADAAQQRRQARSTQSSLFEGRRVRRAGDLFAECWGPAAADPRAVGFDANAAAGAGGDVLSAFRVSRRGAARGTAGSDATSDGGRDTAAETSDDGSGAKPLLGACRVVARSAFDGATATEAVAAVAASGASHDAEDGGRRSGDDDAVTLPTVAAPYDGGGALPAPGPLEAAELTTAVAAAAAANGDQHSELAVNDAPTDTPASTDSCQQPRSNGANGRRKRKGTQG